MSSWEALNWSISVWWYVSLFLELQSNSLILQMGNGGSKSLSHLLIPHCERRMGKSKPPLYVHFAPLSTCHTLPLAVLPWSPASFRLASSALSHSACRSEQGSPLSSIPPPSPPQLLLLLLLPFKTKDYSHSLVPHLHSLLCSIHVNTFQKLLSRLTDGSR